MTPTRRTSPTRSSRWPRPLTHWMTGNVIGVDGGEVMGSRETAELDDRGPDATGASQRGLGFGEGGDVRRRIHRRVRSRRRSSGREDGHARPRPAA